MKIGLNELTAFKVIADKKSFSAAAKVLGVSSSALSHTLKNMERTLNVRLFNRTTRSVSLTEVGETFLQRIQPSMIDLQEAMNELSTLQNSPEGKVRISSSDTGSVPLIKEFLPSFVEQYPDIEVEIVAESRFIDIVSEGFDAGIRLYDDVPADMIAVKLTPALSMVTVASPAYLENVSLPQVPHDLKEHACIRYRFDSGALNLWELSCGAETTTIDVQGPLTLGNTSLMVEAALAGLGIAWVPEAQIEEELASGALVRVLPDWQKPLSELCLYYPVNPYPPIAFKLFIEALREWVLSGRQP